jgi:hypothetical protein
LKEKLVGAFDIHASSLTLQDKVHLKLYGRGILPETLLESLNWTQDELAAAL